MKVRHYAGLLTLSNFSTGLLVSVLSLIMLDKGLTLGGLALAVGIYSVTAAVLEVPSGITADILGRKHTFILALFISALAFAVLLFMQGSSWVLIAVALTGAGRAMSSGTIEALFISRHNEAYGVDRLPKAMRILELTESAGIAPGALLGGFLPSLSAAILPGRGLYDLNLLLRVALSLLLAGLTALLIPCDRGMRLGRTGFGAHLRDNVRLVSQSRTLKWLLLSSAGLGIVLCALEAYWQPLLLHLLGGGQKTVVLGVLSTLYFGAVIAGNLVSEKLLSRRMISEKVTFATGRVAMLASMVGATLFAQPWVFMALYCVMYFCLGASNLSEGTLIHRETPDGSRASMLSTQSFMMQAGMMSFSVGAAALVEMYSIQVMWLVAAAGSALLLGPALHFFIRSETAHKSFQITLKDHSMVDTNL